jgi:RND superfamily putative drug exporter
MAFVGRLVVRFRYPIIVAWLVVTAVCVHAFPSLASVVNSDTASLLPATAPILHAQGMATSFAPATRSSFSNLVAVRADGRLTPADQAAIAAVEAAVQRVPRVLVVHDQGFSADGQVRKALVATQRVASGPPQQALVDAIRATFTDHPLPTGLALHLTGALATAVDTQSAVDAAGRTTQLASDIAILLMLLVVFRAVLAPLVTLLPAVLVLVLSSSVIAEASLAGLPVTGATQVILTVLILGAGTDYGLFLILRVREEINRGRPPREAIVEAMARVGESITFSAGTVICALLCLLLAVFGIYHGIGPGLAIGVALMLLAALTLLPALLAVFGPAVFWPARVGAGIDRPGAWGRIAGYVVQRPAATLVAGIVLFGALAIAATAYRPSGLAGAITGPAGSDSAAGTAALVAHFPIGVVYPTNVLVRFPTSVWKNLAVVDAAQKKLAASGAFSAVYGLLNPNGTAISPAQLQVGYRLLGPPGALSPVPPRGLSPNATYLYNAYRSLSQFVSPDGRTVQFYAALTAGNPQLAAAVAAVPATRRAVAAVAREVGAVDSAVGGLAPLGRDVSDASGADLAHILPVVLILIALLLALVVRSLVAPVYLVASVALSYFSALGVAVLIFTVAGHADGLNFVLPFLMFVFLLALGEDYNILVMSRIREEARTAPLAIAVTRALNATGTTITSAGLILAVTFGVAGLTGATDQVREFGIGVAVGILMDTFLVRTLLVPSVVVLLGRWNWWPSALARRPEQTPSQQQPVAAR